MAATCPIHFDVGSLREGVRALYSRVATEPHSGFHFHVGFEVATSQLGYDASELAELPRLATERFAGVGGSQGRAIGVDMTPAMREQAMKAAELAGVAAHTRILPGLLAELPVASESVDVVISNGVLNLSPDKLVSAAGLSGGRVRGRFQSFAGTSAEAKVSADLRLGAVNFSATKPANSSAKPTPKDRA